MGSLGIPALAGAHSEDDHEQLSFCQRTCIDSNDESGNRPVALRALSVRKLPPWRKVFVIQTGDRCFRRTASLPGNSKLLVVCPL